MATILYHNTRCGTSRKVLAALEKAGINVEVVEYLKHPLAAPELKALAARLGIGAGDLARHKDALFKELGLDTPGITDQALFEAMAEHPRLMQRPIIVADDWVAICRPAERVNDFIATRAP